jgi:hypothetical protein
LKIKKFISNCFFSLECGRSIENERLLMNNQLENDKFEFERKLKEAETERQDLLDKNRVEFLGF